MSEQMGNKKYWWADSEEGPYNGTFENRDLAISDAYCSRASCFDDPSQQDGFWLLCGEKYENKEFDPEYPNDWYENAKHHITGKPEYILSIDITDKFHDDWIKQEAALQRANEVIRLAEEALKCWKLFMPVRDGDTLYSGHPKVMGDEALSAIAVYKAGDGGL